MDEAPCGFSECRWPHCLPLPSFELLSKHSWRQLKQTLFILNFKFPPACLTCHGQVQALRGGWDETRAGHETLKPSACFYLQTKVFFKRILNSGSRAAWLAHSKNSRLSHLCESFKASSTPRLTARHGYVLESADVPALCARVPLANVRVHVSEDNRPQRSGLKGQVRVFKEKLCVSHPWITAMKWALVTQPESVKGPQRGPAIAAPSLPS